MWKHIVVVLIFGLVKEHNSYSEVEIVFQKLTKLLNFIEEYYEDINIDALLGVTFAKVLTFAVICPYPFLLAELRIAYEETNNIYIKYYISILIKKCNDIKEKVLPILPRSTYKMILFQHTLINSDNWAKHIKPFEYNNIKNLGIYNNWTSYDILKNKKAAYKGIQTDVCITEIIEYSNKNQECFVSPLCKEMMFEERIDTGYLLTHRLLYMQILILKECMLAEYSARHYTKEFCSLIYKEAKTNAKLGYPYHDIFLEQSLLCGMEGYAEFLKPSWLYQILSWQEPAGCYKSIAEDFSKRTSNIIEYGCSDHSTGLASGVLALYLRFITSNIKM